MTADHPPLAVAVLAAGAGRRFGAIKPLAVLAGRTLLRRALDTARQLPDADVYVVLGAEVEAIIANNQLQGAHILYNPYWREGMAASLRHAAQELKHYSGILFLAVDQPLVTTQNLVSLTTAWKSDPERKAAAYYGGKPGIPAIFPKRCYPALTRLYGDRGAKPLLQDESDRPTLVVIPEAASDLDTMADLEEIEARLQSEQRR